LSLQRFRPKLDATRGMKSGPLMILPGIRCLAALLLFFLALGGADVPATPPLTDAEAAAAAMRFVVEKANRVVPGGWIACVGLHDESGPFETKLIGDLLVENPGLRPISGCRIEGLGKVYLVGTRERVPLVSCGAWPSGWRMATSPKPASLNVACHIHHGPLDGIWVGFDVRRVAIGTIEVTPNEERLME
jgi:hypothetical protein